MNDNNISPPKTRPSALDRRGRELGLDSRPPARFNSQATRKDLHNTRH